MIKIFSSEQVKKADLFTIQNEPIKSIDLMERAANECFNWLKKFNSLADFTFFIFCGPGNNGGDGLAIARLLKEFGCKLTVIIPDETSQKSVDFAENLLRANNCGIQILYLKDAFSINIPKNGLIIDALFGTGLSRSLTGIYAELIELINKTDCVTISIDIPSGLFADSATSKNNSAIVKADYTLSFEFPKLGLLLPENDDYVGDWHILPIGIHQDFIKSEACKHFLVQKSDVRSILKPRKRFSHKGSFGHAYLIGGSKGKIGAAVLMAKACLRAGSGLTTIHVPGCGYQILQSTVPEVMVTVDDRDEECSRIIMNDKWTAIGVGPGLGSLRSSANLVKLLIQEANVPLLLDADALNILSENKTWMAFLPQGSVLTPHPGEFARLAGQTDNSFERLSVLKELCIKFGINIVLKGAFTIVCSPLGNCYFNPTGNSGMAKGGSGDALTGIITSLLAQGYNPTEACIAGVYLHGLAADIAVLKQSTESLIASDIIENLGNAFNKLH